MKKLLIAAGVLATFAGRSAAWEVKDNPDRYISVGVNTGTDHIAGSTNNLLNPNQTNETLEDQRKSGNVSFYGFDLRVPLFKQVTFSFSYDKYHVDNEIIRGANTWQNLESLNGQRVTIGARFYLTK